jgi:hypothetical protein
VKKHRMPNLGCAARNAICERPMTGGEGSRAATNCAGVSFLHQKFASTALPIRASTRRAWTF